MWKIIFISSILIISSCYLSKLENNDIQQDNKEKGIKLSFNELSLELTEKSLNSKELYPYLHFEVESRLPLQVLYSSLEIDEEYFINCFNKTIKVSKTVDKNIGSVIELLEVIKNDDRIRLFFRSSIEGIKLTTTFQKQNDKWKKIEVIIVEN
jgi:hypothetical protein